MFEKIKRKLKKFAILCIPMYIFSVYFALVYQHFKSANELKWSLGPLLKDIGVLGFPFKESLIILGILLLVTGFLIYQSKKDNFEEDERNFKYSDSGVYGTAGLLTESELKGYCKVNNAKEAEGVILGQLDETGNRIVNTDMNSRMNKHVAIFGASGTGKSRCYARPFIINAVKRRESIIVTDPKGELYESTAKYLQDNGYIVKIFDLVHPAKSDGWNMLKEIRGDELRAQILANVIINNTGGGDSVWDNSAESLLKALMLRVERGHDFAKNNRQSIGEAYNLIQNPAGESYLDTVFDVNSLTRDEKCCLGPYMTFKQGSDNMRGNIITGLATRLQVFQNEVIREITAKDDIDLVLPAKQPCAYFCIMSDQHSALNFLSSSFFTSLFIDLVEYADMNGGVCPVPVNFLLDEFPNIGSIPDFDKKIATVRSRRLNISIIFQGITQLQARYPEGKWVGILGNCDTHLFLGCNEPETAKFISGRTGDATIKVKTEQHEKIESFFQIGRKHSSGDGKRKIMTEDEVMRVPGNEELIILRGKNVMKAYKYDFSQHPEAKYFSDIRIQDRPDITDVEGRKVFEEQAKKSVEDYYNNLDKKKKANTAKAVHKDSILNHIKKKTNSAESKKVHKKNIKPKGDIELTNNDYKETILDFEENEIIETSDIEILDEFQAEKVEDIEIEPIKADSERNPIKKKPKEVQSINSELKTEYPKAEETKKDDSYGKKENAEFKIELIKEKGCPSMEKILTRMLEKIEEVSAA